MPAPPSAALSGNLVQSREVDHSVIRGIYETDKDTDPDWSDVKTFDTGDAARAWYAPRVKITNPAYSECTQIYTTLADWNQVQHMLLAPLERLRTLFPAQPPRPLPKENVFSSEDGIIRALRSRLDAPHHALMNEDSTLNTLRYLFFHMRCGIFVCIRRNSLRLFVPFVNRDYVNTWGDELEIEGGDLTEYVKDKHDAGTREVYIADRRRWWANGNIVCNVASPGLWGDAYLAQLRHMLQTLCARREVPDAEFFINKRDFPQLKANLTEPYDFLFDRDNVPLSRELYATYAPVASFFVGDAFSDLPLVNTDDWETATGLVFPPAGNDVRSAKNRELHDVPWSQRTATAVFRGTSTGPGVEATTNQRIALAKLSAAWAHDTAHSAGNAIDGVRFLDAGIVGWNLRDRKLQGRPMTFIKPGSLALDLAPRVPQYAQARFKFAVYVDGHCAAARYASLMALGSLIFKVNSAGAAGHLWFFPILRAYDWRQGGPVTTEDHVAVAADLSDLSDALVWAKTHDVEAESVARNARALHARVAGVDGQLDYLQLMVTEIAARFRSARPCAGSTGIDHNADPAGEMLMVPAFAAPARPSLPAAFAVSASLSGDSDSDVTATARFDWFGGDNIQYAAARIGCTVGDPPVTSQLATHACECPTCAKLRSDARSRAEATATLVAAAEAERAAQRASIVSAAHPLSSSSTPAAAAAAPVVPPPTALVVNDRVRAAAAAAAALSRQRAIERARGILGPGGPPPATLSNVSGSASSAALNRNALGNITITERPQRLVQRVPVAAGHPPGGTGPSSRASSLPPPPSTTSTRVVSERGPSVPVLGHSAVRSGTSTMLPTSQTTATASVVTSGAVAAAAWADRGHPPEAQAQQSAATLPQTSGGLKLRFKTQPP